MENQELKNGNGFELMFDLQYNLLKKLKIIEGLPDYPLDLENKENQNWLRKFCYRFLEELAEATQEAHEAYIAINTNNRDLAKVHVREYNIEISDALHFLIEIFIYSGFNPDMIWTILENQLRERNIESLIITNDLLGTFLNLGRFLNRNSGLSGQSKFMIFSKVEWEEPNTIGFHRISGAQLNLQNEYLWGCSIKFLMAMNELKNKDWNQSLRSVNTIKFYENLLNGTIILFQYLEMVGYNQVGLINNFIYKDNIVHKRIDAKY